MGAGGNQCGRRCLVTISDPGVHFHRQNRFLMNPVDINDVAFRREQVFFKTDLKPVLFAVHADNIVGGRSRAVDTAPLPDGKKMQPLVPAQYVAASFFYKSGSGFKFRLCS